MGRYALILAAMLPLTPVYALAQQAAPAAAPTPKEPANPSLTQNVETTNRAVGYTAWDDDFFYVAVQVNKPTLTGRNSQPFSNPLEDDAVYIAIQTDDDRTAARPTAHTVFVAASAAGGAQLYSGAAKTPLFNGFDDLSKRLTDIAANEKDAVAQNLKRAALLGSVIKFQVDPHGISRAGGAPAPGYTVEIAIPWSDLGGRPNAGTKMGINFAAQSVSAGSPPLQSFSPKVKTAADIDTPALWSEIIFSNAAVTPPAGTLVCPRVFSNKPVIDGDLTSGEWNTISMLEFGERAANVDSTVALARTIAARQHPPFMLRPARPVIPLTVSNVPPAMAAHKAQPVTQLVMARYDYRYQADARKAAPFDAIVRASGGTALAHHPFDGIGPWFSYDHADWHRRQLLDIRRAGIDVILPEYRGAARDRQTYADKGLLVLASALNSLKQSGQDYPQVGMFLETDSLAEVFGDKPDLKQPSTQAALYEMIRDFYRRIPAPFRCQVVLNAANGSRTACPVFLSSAEAFKDLDGSFVSYVRGRFAADFDGADLVLLGDRGFKAKAPLDGYFQETKDKGFQFEDGGWIKTASVGAGYDSSFLDLPAGEKIRYRPRHNGDTYRVDWKAAVASKPDWVLLDGWNDYSVGAEIAPTLETGYTTSDITVEYTHLLLGFVKRGVKFVSADAPHTLSANGTGIVHLRLQNTGIDVWGTGDPTKAPVSVAYKWLQAGHSADGGMLPLTTVTVILEDTDVALPVSAANLAPGDYTLEIRLIETGKKGDASLIGGDTPGASLQLPIRIVGTDVKLDANTASKADNAPGWAASVISSDLPVLPERGSVYTVHAVLRNDGTQTWRKADGAQATLRLYRSDLPGAELSEGIGITETLVPTADASAVLTQDVLPGQETNVTLNLPLMDAAGAAVPLWTQDNLWTYLVRWEISSGHGNAVGSVSTGSANGIGTAKATSVIGALTSPAAIGIVDFDFGARFITDKTPAALPAERRQPVPVSVRNDSAQTWKKDSVRIGYHWYYEDGTEFLWEDETTPISADVAPGGVTENTLAYVTAPPYNGNYWLVWDVKFGDTWASTAAGTRSFDQTMHAVRVLGSKLIFAELKKYYNVDGLTDDDNLLQGDFDGQGHTFPAALVPPFANGDPVPSTIWLPTAKSGPDSPRRISFRWGPKEGNAKSFISCQGQRIELGKSGGQCSILHLLAASGSKDASAEVKLIFQEPTSQSEDLYSFTVSAWNKPPKTGEEVAFVSPRHHERDGVVQSAVALYHYTIKIREPRKLVAIQLPDNPDIKIAAITLEK